MNLDYFKKAQTNIFEEILWNIPEQKTGTLQIIGGNANSFSAEIKQAELLNTFNLKEVRLILPDILRSKVPPVPGVNFAPSTESGSFKKSPELDFAFNDADLNFLAGDFSKNSETAIAIVEAIKKSTKPIVFSKDSLDLVVDSAEDFIEKDLIFIASLTQVQKLFKSLLYPKMVLLSSPLIPVVEALHKFTLSYPVTILTIHADHIIIASRGEVVATPIEDTDYSPISLLMGNLAAKVAALNLWSPTDKRLEATHSALFYNK